MKRILIALLLIAVLFIGGCVGVTTPTGQTVAKTEPKVTTTKVTTTICRPNWECSDWTECTKQGYKTRTCTDKNSCGTDVVKPEARESCTYIYKKDETISLEGMEYTMYEAYSTPYIGGEYFGSEADGVYVVLCFNVKNMGKKANTIYSSDFVLYDDQEREFDDTYIMSLENQIMIMEKLNPGIDIDICLAYDVPEDNTGMYCEISPSFWGKSEYVWAGSTSQGSTTKSTETKGTTTTQKTTTTIEEETTTTIEKSKSAKLTIDRVQIQLANLYPTRVTVENTGEATIYPKFDLYVYDEDDNEVCSGSPLFGFGAVSSGKSKTDEISILGCMFEEDGDYELKIDLLDSDYNKLDTDTETFTVDYWGQFGL